MLRTATCFALIFCVLGLIFLPVTNAEITSDDNISVDCSFMPPKGYPGGGNNATISILNKENGTVTITRMHIEIDWKSSTKNYHVNYSFYSSGDFKIAIGQSKKYSILFDVENLIPVGIYNYTIYIDYNINRTIATFTHTLVSDPHNFEVVATAAEAYGNQGFTFWTPLLLILLILGIVGIIAYIYKRRM